MDLNSPVFGVRGHVPPPRNFCFKYTLNNAFWRHIYTELRNQAISPVIISKDWVYRYPTKKLIQDCCSLVSPVSLSLLQTLVIFPRSANIYHQGTEISQPLSVLPHLGAWEKSRFFQNDGLTECKITRLMLLPLTLRKMR